MIKDISDLCGRLFPICRSITGNGVRKTLSILNEICKLDVLEFESGSRVFDWIIPDEWNIKNAFIKDIHGNKIVDFNESNLHIVGYSEPFEGWVGLEDLKEHLFSMPDKPDWIPYITSYYKKVWGFCIEHNKLLLLKDQKYYVKIDSSFSKGKLCVGEIFIEGQSREEIQISCNICHPSMANNELSGMIVAINLAKILQNRNNRYSYRIIFLPETIGAIAYIHKFLDRMKENIIAGYHLTCIGDRGDISYLMSKEGVSLSDRAAINVLGHNTSLKIYDFLDRGSDERQFCFPGVDLPIGSIMRTRYDTYPEYHTSADNLSFISAEKINDSISKCFRVLEALEKNKTYKCNVICEPHLGKHDLYPSLSTRDSINYVRTTKNILAYCDGKNDLIDISNKIGVPMQDLYEKIDKFIDCGIIKEV